MRGVLARWGDPARGIPTLLDPIQAKEHYEPRPLPHFEPGPPPSAPLWEGARGKGSRLERGSQLVGFSNYGRFGRGNATSWVPHLEGPTRKPRHASVLNLARTPTCKRFPRSTVYEHV